MQNMGLCHPSLTFICPDHLLILPLWLLSRANPLETTHPRYVMMCICPPGVWRTFVVFVCFWTRMCQRVAEFPCDHAQPGVGPRLQGAREDTKVWHLPKWQHEIRGSGWRCSTAKQLFAGQNMGSFKSLEKPCAILDRQSQMWGPVQFLTLCSNAMFLISKLNACLQREFLNWCPPQHGQSVNSDGFPMGGKSTPAFGLQGKLYRPACPTNCHVFVPRCSTPTAGASGSIFRRATQTPKHPKRFAVFQNLSYWGSRVKTTTTTKALDITSK